MSFDQLLADAYLEACHCEINAFKPGNVSVHSDGHGMVATDFFKSAEVSAQPISNPEYTLGKKIFYALAATHDAVGCNTNLGIVLLCAPLIHASQLKSTENLRSNLNYVLENTTVSDAEWVYRGIRLAKPAGMGQSDDQDIQNKPNVNLTETMRIASHRDRIAYQYVSGYEDVFDFAKNRYHTAVGQWGEETWAAVAVFVGLLRQFPDSHIERKFGSKYTRMVDTRMALLDEELSGSKDPKQCLKRIQEVDAEFKVAGINPGTTADLTVATLLVVSLEALLSQRK